MEYEIIRLADRPEITGQATVWFHENGIFRWKSTEKAWKPA